jgi:hypothetical protein
LVSCSLPQSYQVAIESRMQTGEASEGSSESDVAPLRGRGLPRFQALDRPGEPAGKSEFPVAPLESPMVRPERVAHVPTGATSDVIIVNIIY